MSATDNALAIIRDGRIRMVRSESTAERYVFRVVGDTDPLSPHTVTVYRDGGVFESCTCPGSEFHPVRPRCSHVRAVRLILAAVDSPLQRR